MEKLVIVFALGVLVSSCGVKPVPVRLSELKSKSYVQSGIYTPISGDFKNKAVALAYYDGVPRAIVDDKGQALEFKDNISILNFLAPFGWEYVETSKVEVKQDVKVWLMLLKKKD